MTDQNTLADLSTTAASNTNWKGQSIQGTAPVLTIDQMLQNLSAMLAGFYDSLGGSLTAGGTATALTVTITEDWAAYAHGNILAIKTASAASGASTLTVTVPTAGSLGSKKIRRQGDSAIQANDWLSGATILLKYDSAYDTAAGAWVLLNGAGSSGASASQLPTPTNLSLTASVGSSALTVALKGVDGNDPSASNPVVIPFRSATASTGTPDYLTATAATSIVISSGSTMGFTSGTIGRLWIVAFNDAGTLRLGAVNALSGTSIMALRNGIYSSTAEGGAGAADSAQVIYTGTAVTSKAMTVLGYIEATEATAGTWATAPSLIKIWQPGDPLPGDCVQTKRTDTGAVATGTTTIPHDDTIPQITEGDQYMSLAITPNSGCNLLKISIEANLTNSNTNLILVMALFRDAAANALTNTAYINPSGSSELVANLNWIAYAAAATSTTFKMRAGASSANTTTFNGSAGSRTYGGALNSYMNIAELMA